MENITGQMEVTLKVIFKMALEKAKEFGRKDMEIQKDIKVSINWIKSKDTAFTHGKMEVYTKETSSTI